MKLPFKHIIILLTGILLFSCGNRKKEPVAPKADTITLAPDTAPNVLENLVVTVDTLEVPEPGIIVNEYFDDFIFRFATDKQLQHKRIVFPLPYYRKDDPVRIEEYEWEHDSLFTDRNYYTLLFDNEEDMELHGVTEQNSIQLEWIYMIPRQLKKYYFERIHGKWILEAINLYPFEEGQQTDFLDFYISFSTDSLFQANHIANPLEFVTTDPDDDFAILETTLDRNQWFAFRPELPLDKFTNINFGQKNDIKSSHKIVHLKGIGNGFLNTLFFRKKHGKWELYKFEDTSN